MAKKKTSDLKKKNSRKNPLLPESVVCIMCGKKFRPLTKSQTVCHSCMQDVVVLG